MLTLSERTCNAIYWNSEEAHVFCSSLSFQQAPMDICMTNKTQVTAGFVKTIAHTPTRGARSDEKMVEAFNVWKHGKCKAGYTLFGNHNETWTKQQNWYTRRIVYRRRFVAFCEMVFLKMLFVLFHQASGLHNKFKEIFRTNWRSRLRSKTLDDQWILCSMVFRLISQTYNFFDETFVSSMFCCRLRIVSSPRFFRRITGVFRP